MMAFMATVSIFSIGSFCRPFGALLFGYLGDKYGRASTLRLSILMIVIPTILLGILPTYQQIGIFAPIFLLLIRMLQGVSVGGEYSGSIIYFAESAPPKHGAFTTSFACIGANLGILIASLVGIMTTSFFSETTLLHWGWRITYLASGILCLLIYFFRLKLVETPTFIALKQQHRISKNPIIRVFKNDLRYIFRTIGMVCMGTTFYFFCFVYLPIYLKQIPGHSIQDVSILMSIMISLMIVFVPIAGIICDRFGRRKMLLFNAILITIITVPAFYGMQIYNGIIFSGIFLLLTIASSLEQGTTPVALVENFPTDARYTGVSLGYNLGNGFLGGTVPLVCGWLLQITQITILPAIYIAACAIVTGLVVFFYIPE